MKRLNMVYLTALLMLLSPLTSLAQAQLKVVWQNPDKYTDVKPANGTKSAFRKHTFSELEKYIRKLVKDFPKGQTLDMTVTNLDLAGEVWPSMMLGLHNSGDVRIVRDLYFPKMKFTYSLKDAQGNVIKQGKADLKDMGFMDRGTLLPDSDGLRYEKNMLKRWFKKTFTEQYAAKQH